jgi:hypothetical protein
MIDAAQVPARSPPALNGAVFALIASSDAKWRLVRRNRSMCLNRIRRNQPGKAAGSRSEGNSQYAATKAFLRGILSEVRIAENRKGITNGHILKGLDDGFISFLTA